MPKNQWKEYFAFSKKQRNGIFILLGIMAAFIGFTFWYKPMFINPHIDKGMQEKLARISAKQKEVYIDTIDEDVADSIKETTAYRKPQITHALFYFDPNTLDAEGLRRLGFGEKTTEHIIEYRKTNRFAKPEDLYKIPRIRKKTVAAVLPYVRIGNNTKPLEVQKTSVQAATPQDVKQAYKVININTATAEDFKVFPGVSDAVAARIIKFRVSIGGFKSVDDVAKTYGLPAASFKAMLPYLKL